MEYITRNEEETRLLAEMLGRAIKPGTIILAYGDLGAGKTCFAQGLARGLGIDKKINSPTFNIIKEYIGSKINFYHIDAYRLESKDAISDIGFEDIFNDPNNVSYIEWPDFITEYLKEYKNVISVTLTSNADDSRIIKIESKI